MKLKAVVPSVNIRGYESRKNKNNEPYLLVRFEDMTGKPCELVDKDMDRKSFYQRGQVMDLEIEVDQGRQFTTIRIVGIDDSKGCIII